MGPKTRSGCKPECTSEREEETPFSLPEAYYDLPGWALRDCAKRLPYPRGWRRQANKHLFGQLRQKKREDSVSCPTRPGNLLYSSDKSYSTLKVIVATRSRRQLCISYVIVGTSRKKVTVSFSMRRKSLPNPFQGSSSFRKAFPKTTCKRRITGARKDYPCFPDPSWLQPKFFSNNVYASFMVICFFSYQL